MNERDWIARDNFSVDRHQELLDVSLIARSLTPTGDGTEVRTATFGHSTAAAMQRLIQVGWAVARVTSKTSPATLGGGWYGGRSQRFKGTGLDPTTNLSLSSAMEDRVAGTDDVYIAYLPESGTGNHGLAVDGSVYVLGRWAELSGGSIESRPVVQVGNSTAAGVLFRVNLTKTSGSTGSKTTTASWVYTAKTLDNNTTLGTGLSPERSRPNGTRIQATIGTGYYNTSGTFVLYEADEPFGTGGC